MKAIKVSDAVYDTLSEERRDGESYNDVLERRLDLDGRYLTAEEVDSRIKSRVRELMEGRR